MYVHLACNKKNITFDFYIAALPWIYIFIMLINRIFQYCTVST